MRAGGFAISEDRMKSARDSLEREHGISLNVSSMNASYIAERDALAYNFLTNYPYIQKDMRQQNQEMSEREKALQESDGGDEKESERTIDLSKFFKEKLTEGSSSKRNSLFGLPFPFPIPFLRSGIQ